MASAISYAIGEIVKYRIPESVLRQAFKPNPYQNYFAREAAPYSLDELVLQNVIRPRVLLDANLVGGQTLNIPLEGADMITADNYTQIYRIPKEILGNRTIISVLSIAYVPYSSMVGSVGVGSGNIALRSMNDTTVSAQRLGEASSAIPNISTARVELIAENTIMVTGIIRMSQGYSVRCVLSNDEDLNNINPRSFPEFATLCELAVKSYIYNTLYFKMDKAFLEGGQELGVMKSYVESLQDSENMYQTQLKEVWAKVAYMNNIEDWNKHLRLMLSPQL